MQPTKLTVLFGESFVSLRDSVKSDTIFFHLDTQLGKACVYALGPSVPYKSLCLSSNFKDIGRQEEYFKFETDFGTIELLEEVFPMHEIVRRNVDPRPKKKLNLRKLLA